MILFASAGHAPGVTAVTVALGVTWPGPMLLADCSCLPDQSVLAGYLQGVNPAGRGLGALLQAHRERRPLAEVLPQVTVPIDEAEGQDFLPGFSHPGMVGLFGAVWPELAAVLGGEDRPVLIDAGRITPSGLPAPLVTASDLVVLVTGSRLVDLAAVRLYLPLLAEEVEPERLGLIVVGPGRPYGSGEIAQRFGLPVWGKVGWHPQEAAVFAAGEPRPRRLETGAYLRDIRALGERLSEAVAARERLIGVRR